MSCSSVSALSRIRFSLQREGPVGLTLRMLLSLAQSSGAVGFETDAGWPCCHQYVSQPCPMSAM